MTESRSLIAGRPLLLADLDGVVYAGADAIPYAVESINTATETVPVAYVTNNASRTAASVAEHLSSLGLTVAADDVVTSPQAAMRLLVDLVPAGSRILVVGGEGLTHEVTLAGFEVTDSALDNPAALVQGFSPEVGWKHLAEASFALRGSDKVAVETAGAPGGIPWIATNTDWTIPVARGIAPGNGTLVSAVHTAVGRLPIVAGKPEVAIFTAALERYGVAGEQDRPVLVIGDRLDTDILGGNRSGLETALVLTGIDRAKQVLAAIPAERPTFILDDLRQLAEPYPVTVETVDAATGDTLTRVGDAVVRRRANVLSVDAAGARQVDLLRAGAAAIWNSGLAIYGLQVPAELYS